MRMNSAYLSPQNFATMLSDDKYLHVWTSTALNASVSNSFCSYKSSHCGGGEKLPNEVMVNITGTGES